ncbi:MAG: STAS domain-containing protein [Umezawaea sp.]
MTPELARDHTLITISGELDADTAWQLSTRLDDASGVVVLDLTAVPFFDSVALACLLEASHRGVDLRVAGSPQVIRTMTLTEAHRVVPVVESVAEALALPTR